MKTTTACIGALSLASLVAAQPSGHRRHQVLHEKRGYVATVTDIVTDYMPEVIVYVDEDGNILSEVTVTNGQVATSLSSTYIASTTPATSSADATSSVYVAATSSVTAAADYAASSSTASSSSSAASSTSTSVTGPSGYGITYSPYTDSGDCKTADQVAGDFESLTDYDFVRTYGVDCNQVETVLAACKANDMKLMLGVYYIDETTSAIATIVEAVVDGDWDYIDTIAIGNEAVNDGTYTVDEVVAAIDVARTLLAVTDFAGKIVTVDTFTAIIANPELCENSDYAAANAHPFFDGSVAAADAGPWVLEQMDRVSAACGDKTTWITETGWPTQGETNGDAVPGSSEQAAALASVKESLSSNVIFFNAFNDLWKTNTAATFDTEQYWGIYGDSSYQ